MSVRKTLSGIVLAGFLLVPGCGSEVEPVENVQGTVVNEFFYEGYEGKWLAPDIEDEYRMIVKNVDGHTRLYFFTGKIAEQYDDIYNFGSEVNLPKEGRNVRLLK